MDLLKCHFQRQVLSLSYLGNLIQLVLRSWEGHLAQSLLHWEFPFKHRRSWPGYCCLWYLLVKFLNQYSISRRSSWEWKPAAVYLILEPACALCSAAKLGSWPTWCGIIAAEVRCEWLGESWWMAVCDEASLPPTRRHLIMIDHNCTHTKICAACFHQHYSLPWSGWYIHKNIHFALIILGYSWTDFFNSLYCIFIFYFINLYSYP